MVNGITPNALPQIGDALKSQLPGEATRDGQAPSFQHLLSGLLSEVDQVQEEADASLERLATGESTSVQDVVLKMEEADLTLKLMKEIRDKLIQAYKETTTMQA